MSDVGRVIVLEQGSPAWYARREKGIGASEVPSIMGQNKYETARAWWERRTGRRPKEAENSFMRHGKQNEEMVRAAYAKILGEPIEPTTYESLRLPVLHASLDGITFDETINVEIKCPRTPTVYEAALRNEVTPTYYGQVQAQLFATGARESHFVVYYEPAQVGDELNLVVVRVKPDLVYFARMIETVTDMWSRVQQNLWEPGKGEEDLSFDEEYAMLARRWLELKDAMAPFEAALEKTEMALKAKATGRKVVEGCGLRISEVGRKGNVDYAQVPQLKGVDLEPYRKPGTSYYKIEQK